MRKENTHNTHSHARTHAHTQTDAQTHAFNHQYHHCYHDPSPLPGCLCARTRTDILTRIFPWCGVHTIDWGGHRAMLPVGYRQVQGPLDKYVPGYGSDICVVPLPKYNCVNSDPAQLCSFSNAQQESCDMIIGNPWWCVTRSHAAAQTYANPHTCTHLLTAI